MAPVCGSRGHTHTHTHTHTRCITSSSLVGGNKDRERDGWSGHPVSTPYIAAYRPASVRCTCSLSTGAGTSSYILPPSLVTSAAQVMRVSWGMTAGTYIIHRGDSSGRSSSGGGGGSLKVGGRTVAKAERSGSFDRGRRAGPPPSSTRTGGRLRIPFGSDERTAARR